MNKPRPGTWTWNDETQSLEFTGFNTSAGIKEKKKASKKPSYQELVREHLIKISQCKSPAKGGSSGLKKSVVIAELNTCKCAAECSQRDSITMEDIKKVAFSLMQEKEALPIPPGFLTVIKSKELDMFLAALLLYLHCYWQRKDLEERSKPCIVEQSTTEQQMMAKAGVKLELAKKHLALCYSSLVLGQGFSQQHHMACGRRRVSSTYRDRHLYESEALPSSFLQRKSLYDEGLCMLHCLGNNFFCYVAWVTFERRDLNVIEAGIGRLLRPDTHNPALRTQRNEPDEEEEEEQEITQEESQSRTFSHKRRLIMLTQCSPLMMSILPSTREKASNVFQRSSLHKQQPDKPIDTDVLMEELSQQLASCSFGILGKPLSQLRHITPMPHGAKMDDEEAEHGGHIDDADNENDNLLMDNWSRKTSFMHQRSATTTAEKRNRPSRAHTVTSRATTEAPLSDTE